MTYLSDKGRRDRENPPRPEGLRKKSGHTSFSPSAVGLSQPSGSALSGLIFVRNAVRSGKVCRPRWKP
jgi:hypothetical protein